MSCTAVDLVGVVKAEVVKRLLLFMYAQISTGRPLREAPTLQHALG